MAEARAAYERAISVDPAMPAPHRNLAVLLDLYLAQPAPALDHYERYHQLAGSADPQAVAWLEELRARMKHAPRTADAQP
jgi:lipoprotein NlpI